MVEYNNLLIDVFKNFSSEDIKMHYKNRNDITSDIINSVREIYYNK